MDEFVFMKGLETVHVTAYSLQGAKVHFALVMGINPTGWDVAHIPA